MRELLTEVGSDLAALAATLPLVDLGSQMNVAGGAAEALFPLNVGLLFFNPEPHWFFPVTQIVSTEAYDKPEHINPSFSFWVILTLQSPS